MPIEDYYYRTIGNAVVTVVSLVRSQSIQARASAFLRPSFVGLSITLSVGSLFVCSSSTRLGETPISAISKNERTESPDAVSAEVVRQVVATYLALSTYSDKGTSIVRLAGGDSTYTVEFETLFKRPEKLRFEWTMMYSHTPGYKQKAVIWSDGTAAWLVASFRGNQPERKKNLDNAVAAATGASWGTVGTISRLLSDKIGGIRLDEIQALRVAGNDTADGVECVVIVGRLVSGAESKFWVGRKDHLIRRIEERSKTMTREEVRKQIVVNEYLSDSRFSEKGL